MWNIIVIAITFCDAKKMICALMFIISNNDGIKCLSNLLQLELCNVMFNVISNIMAHWNDMWNIIVIGKENDLCIDINDINHDGIKYISNLLPCNVMFKVISNIMAHWHDMWNIIVIAINFCNAKKMICALIFIISKLHGIKCLSNLLQLELCNVMLRVITDIMRDWYEMWKIIVIAINFYNAKKMICTIMFIICNHVIKGLSNLSELEPFNFMISDIKEHWYDMWNTIVITIKYCNAKKMMCSLMCIISNHYGIKCLSNLLHVEPSDVMFEVISDRMAHWYDLWNTILIAI